MSLGSVPTNRHSASFSGKIFLEAGSLNLICRQLIVFPVSAQEPLVCARPSDVAETTHRRRDTHLVPMLRRVAIQRFVTAVRRAAKAGDSGFGKGCVEGRKVKSRRSFAW